MELATELKSALDDTSEPLTKRLKIAHNALNSVELVGINKEEILLDWFSTLSTEFSTTEVWQTLFSCLKSQHLQNFRQNEIRQEILCKLVKSISECLKRIIEKDTKKVIVECAINILKNDGFKLYFKHNMQTYCTFLSTVLTNVDNPTDVISVIEDPTIINQKLFVKKDSCDYFLTITASTCFDIILKYDDEQLLQATSKLIQKCIFQNRIKVFEVYLNKIFEGDQKELESLPNLVIHKLLEFYENDSHITQIAFKIIIKAFVNSYKMNNLMLFKFFILILQLIGFEDCNFSDVKISDLSVDLNVDKSFAILSDIFQIISAINIPLDIKIKELSFDEYIKNILKSLFKKRSQLNNSMLKILKTTININPTIIEGLITEIIIYVAALKKDKELENLFSNVFTAIFEMYFKLHRIHKFTSEILRTLKPVLNAEYAKSSLNVTKMEINHTLNIVEDVSEIFPTDVLKYFHHCVTQQSGKQIISIMRTLISHLEEVVNDLQNYATDSNKILYVQLITELLCEFLSAVRVAEYNTTQITLNKFCQDMEQLKSVLAKFGTALLHMEHNQNLIHCFLRICESWGDLVIILNFYYIRSDGVHLKDITPLMDIGDYVTCSTTYLHGYLSVKQWSVMLQRIKNFGEKPCEEIMQKLNFQRIRTFIILNPEQIVKEHKSLLIKKSLLDKDDNWTPLLKENFTEILLLNEDIGHILNVAEYILQDLLADTNSDLLQQKSIINNRNLILAILFTWFSKLNVSFKTKRKHNESLSNKAISSKIFKCINVNDFMKNKNFDAIFEQLPKCFDNLSNIPSLKLDDNKLYDLLGILKNLPICGLPENVQKILFMHILALIIDLRKNNVNDNCISLCEEYLKGLIDYPSAPNVVTVMSNIQFQLITKYAKNFRELLSIMLNKAFKCNETVKIMKNGIESCLDHLDKNLHLEIIIQILSALNFKASKYRLSEENREYIKEYKEELCNDLCPKLSNNADLSNVKLEAYVLVLQYYLQKDDFMKREGVMKLVTLRETYVDYCVINMDIINNEVGLLLFEILLREKSRISLSEDFIMKCWSACKCLKNINNDCVKQLNKTVSLIFEYISSEQFEIILGELLVSTTNPLECDKNEEFENYLKIWQCLLNSALNTVKQEIFVNSLLKLLEHTVIYLINNDNNYNFDQVVVKLQVDIIEHKRIIPNGNMLDIYLQTVSVLLSRKYEFTDTFTMCFAILDTLMQKRKFIIADRLPSYLVNLRMLLNKLCVNSNVDDNNLNRDKKKFLDCVFQFEKLIKAICILKTDMARIVPYFISDILKNYEKITFSPAVKNHLDNCLYHLIGLCDHHAVSYLFRVLSTASTELFKNVYHNYNKYHKFAGRI